MNLALYVHDFRLEIGHSNSLIELIRHLPKDFLNKVNSIEVISCRAAPLAELFPEYKGQLKWIKIPIEKVGPSILKSILFQLLSYLYTIFFQKKDTFRIGIGICCMNVDAVSIQFIHHQWTKCGLVLEKKHPIRLWYKKILFYYYEFCEKKLFTKKGLFFFSPAEFLTCYLQSNFPGIDATTIYSGVNVERFNVSEITRAESLDDLIDSYPQLKTLDLTKPIYLFVGAYERKGIERVLQLLTEQTGAQLIVVGSPSAGRNVKWPKNLKIYKIHFSKQIEKFYTLSDVFIFPTLYEPFGLVLFEAMAMGLTIITNEKNVGASELLKGLDDVYFCDKENFAFPAINPKSVEDKKRLRTNRMIQLGNVSWIAAGEQLSNLIAEKTKHSS